MTELKTWEKEIINKFGSLYLRYSADKHDDIIRIYGIVPLTDNDWFARCVNNDGDEDVIITYRTDELLSLFTPVDKVEVETYKLIPLVGQESLYYKDSMSGEIRRIPNIVGRRKSFKKIEWVVINK